MPVAAVVVDDEGTGPMFVAMYLVRAIADHPQFEKGQEIRIRLRADTKVVHGGDRRQDGPARGLARGDIPLTTRWGLE